MSGCSRGDDLAPSAPASVGDAARTDGATVDVASRSGPDAAPAPVARPGGPITPEELLRVARGSVTFGLALYGQLRSQPGNLVFSPLGVSASLAMIGAGARGETQAELARVLGVDPADARVHGALATLARRRDVAQSGLGGLSFAQRVDGPLGTRYAGPYAALLEREYGGAPGAEDFTRGDFALPIINEWIAERTRFYASGVLPTAVLTPRASLLVASGAYFRDPCEAEFEARATRDEFFQVSPSLRVAVRTMHATVDAAYGEREGVRVLELVDHGGDTTIDVLLPASGDLAALEACLTPAALAQWTAGLARRSQDVALPRLRLATTGSLLLGRALAAMGAPRVFDAARAELPGVGASATGAALWVSEVYHRAFVEVSERTRSGAPLAGMGQALGNALSSVVRAVSAGSAERPVLRVDGPFVLLVRDRPTGALLFVARVRDPRGT